MLGTTQERQQQQEVLVASLPCFSVNWGVEQDVLRGDSCRRAALGENGEGQEKEPRPQTTGEKMPCFRDQKKLLHQN